MQHPARTHFPVKAEILLLVFKTQSRLWNLSDSSTYMASDSAQCQGWKMNDPKGREKITQIYEKKKDKKKKDTKRKRNKVLAGGKERSILSLLVSPCHSS